VGLLQVDRQLKPFIARPSSRFRRSWSFATADIWRSDGLVRDATELRITGHTELYTPGPNLSVADPYGEDVKPVARPPAGQSARRDRDKKPRSSEGTGL
jgi:hypothetical protein